ncbi:ABC transporter substrate-binding protein [Synechococcus sp. CS-197]|uniref:ABC transporter substrate-binding protein n=1 Tax=Synechococcus sp. CS-197 TaxID=2847985 RepID=UPI0001525B40|nr:ABC transporter substrate-binding protein [Synechococcus sp. CS-197]MCT0251020.1 ABC transporter substrate-binding protein [Synechococcus sp. CS-197]CAK24860.1 ABC transport system, substrate binding protein component [Synechococcus sp. WH 7803]
MKRSLTLFAALGLLSACSGSDESRSTLLRVVRTLPANEVVTGEESARDRKLLRDFQTNLRAVIPGLRIQPSLYSATSVQAELQRQTNSGLGPDLVISDAQTIQALFAARLLDPVALTPEQRQAIPAELLTRVSTSNGTITGLPVSQYIQLACYDKRKLKSAPKTLRELAQQSSEGNIFGLTQNFENLYWSVGSYGAGKALISSLRGETPTTQDVNQLVQWLTWLRAASFQQNVLFMNDQATLRQQLIKGNLHWISCWSTQLPQLREALKDNLGVGLLPAGPAGKATPVSRLQVWGLGRNSSHQQRLKSEELMQFIVLPWAQKTWALRYRTSYPVNPAAAQIINREIPGTQDLYLSTDQEDVRIGDEIQAALNQDPKLEQAMQSTLNHVIFGTETPSQAAATLNTKLGPSS